jgi:tetratricopeptide (TPR) repeat protein
MTAPILAYKTARADDPARLKPFRLGATQLYVQPSRTFSRAETLGVGLQVFGLSSGRDGGAKLRYVFRRDGRIVLSRERGVADYAALPDVLEEFPLTEFLPAHYTLDVTGVVDGRDAVTAKEEFDVSPRVDLPRPWFYAKLMPPASDPYYGPIVGGQLLRAGQADRALELFERTIARSGPNAPLLNGLGDCRAALGRPREALEAWEQSLKIDPRQPEILRKAEAIREKK